MPIVEVQGLSYEYPNGVRALDNVSFTIDDGDTVGLVGPSGAGKSTLLMHLNGLLLGTAVGGDASDNSPVHVSGLPVEGRHLPEVRRMVGFLFQDPDDQLFCPTVREDVAFGPLNLGLPPDEVQRRIADSLDAVGLAGYEARSTIQLSVGERKRVCLAGVLSCGPKLLALDEPSGNLDPRARRSLLTILKQFDGSQIIATHDLDLVVDHCHRVIVLDDGQIQASGPPETILSDSALMERHGLEVPLRLQLRNCNPPQPGRPHPRHDPASPRPQ